MWHVASRYEDKQLTRQSAMTSCPKRVSFGQATPLLRLNGGWSPRHAPCLAHALLKETLRHDLLHFERLKEMNLDNISNWTFQLSP